MAESVSETAAALEFYGLANENLGRSRCLDSTRELEGEVKMPASDRDAVKPSAVTLPGKRADAVQVPDRLTKPKTDAGVGREGTRQNPASAAKPPKR
jgi:hypothetical protein